MTDTPPGPARHQAAGVLGRMARDRLAVMTDMARRYGDAVRLPLGPRTLYFFNHPDHARHVLVDNPAGYGKGIGLVHARHALGDGLLTSDGDRWAQQRRVVRPTFQSGRVARQVGVVAAEVDRLVSRLRARSGEPLDLRTELTGVALGVLGRTLLDCDLDRFTSLAAAFEAVQDQAIFDMMTLNAVPAWVPLRRRRAFRRARTELDAVVTALVARRREHADDLAAAEDALSRLIAATDAEPDRRLARTRMRDELVTLLLAGHETTATTLTWAFHLLDRHPAAAARLREEALAVLGDRTPELADLSRLTYTTMVLHETMRLYPPVWLLPRRAHADDEIGGFRVPAGADVVLCPYTLHRHPAFWERPDEFLPERFDGGSPRGLPRYAFLPFGAGPRVCIGSNLALMEAALVLAMVSRSLTLTPVPGHRVRAEPMLTLRMRGGLPVVVRPAA